MCRNAADAKAEPLLYTTAAQDRSSKGSSSLQASAALCKGIIGTGIFALPPAIRAAGWVLGTGMAIACGLVSLYTMVNVMACIRELRRRGVAEDNDALIRNLAGIISRLLLPYMAVWLYLLAIGEGYVCRALSTRLMADEIGRAVYLGCLQRSFGGG